MKEIGDKQGRDKTRQVSAEHMSMGDMAEKLRKKYKIWIAAGLAAIFLTAAAFVYVLAVMPPRPSAVNWVECAGTAALMTAAIIAVTIRLKRLQTSYFSGAAGAAEEYAAELKRKAENGEKK